MSLEANKAVVRAYVDAILVKRDFSKFPDYTAPGFYIDRSAVPEAIVGENALHSQMDMLYGAFPDLDLKVVDMVAEGDKVVVRFEAPGTHQHPFAGIEGTGRRATWKGLVMYHVVDGKLTEAWANWDDWGLINQLK
ncbi:ester cyclase [Hymenobacter sp. RP-2-7]|uniref:Ester cyclase n=1 Tax=Hymenobacter polaris TaxID=2682546 RepID=A0A7Y0ABP1_9BACT|nr:ester cyclase [Hymenobacter polaris]NML64401.1 ester cyclase [Hymenobacter polaris]